MTPAPARVLVTGSSGFIGAHVLQALLARGDQVLGLDRAPPRWPGHAPHHLRCDLLDGRRLREAVAAFAPHGVVHLAARADLLADDVADYAANVEGVANLLAALRGLRGSVRGLFVSTQLVCEVGHRPAADDDYRPTTAYGRSKALGEGLVRAADGGGCQGVWCLLRHTTIWGPGMPRHYHRLFRMIGHGTYFHVGRRPLYKSYGYVGNTAHQLLRFLDAPRAQIHRRTFYLADYAPLSLRGWTEQIRRELGGGPLRTVPVAAARALARLGDGLQRLGDAGGALAPLRGFPFTSFRLNNVLAEYRFDLGETEQVCGPLPFDQAAGVRELVRWLRAEGIV